jgi:hypothetical protein
MVEQRQQGHGWDGKFLGFRARKNCEEMPAIPAWIVRNNLNDPRRIPYLLVWKDGRDDEIKEAVRLACYLTSGAERTWMVELKRTDGSITVLSIVWRMLPHNCGRALFLLCPSCRVPRRHVYGWEWDSSSGWSNVVRSIDWRCRSCARLRYSSEGGYLRPAYGRFGQIGVMLRTLGNLPRPESWLPYVFNSPEAAAEAGVCELSSVSWYGKR